jgi:hypothetical protein
VTASSAAAWAPSPPATAGVFAPGAPAPPGAPVAETRTLVTPSGTVYDCSADV